LPYDVLMPQLGMTMTEGSVVQWLKKPGAAVANGEFLFIVQTDKVDMEIESACAGIFVESLVELGQVVPVGTVIGRIAEAESGKSSEPMQSSTPTSPPAPLRGETVTPSVPLSVAKTAPSPDTHSGKLAQPRAKKLAKELGLDILLVPDYEGRGRIVEADVQRFFDERSAAGPKSKTSPETVSGSAANKEMPSTARNAIAERMTISFQTIPHFYLTVLADATELVKLKRGRWSEIERQVGVHFSYTDVLLKGLAVALREHPEVNVYWQKGVVRRERINIGFAAQAGDRLVAPVVRDADKLPLAELARVRGALVARAHAGKLQADDVGDASCTLSNLGSFGIDYFHAIINPPESVILASGRIASRPMVVDETVVPRQTIYLSLSADHRLIDGITGAEFLNTVVRIVESPETLLQT
jgi:pyruvate dehydrogenase E2 component (dihydrolipoamide acetyltransferase)